MKFAACVILYHPKEADIANILTYLTKVEKLYIYDNTEMQTTPLCFKNDNKVRYFSDNQNNGIAIRLNQACKLAIEEGYDYLLTMDQDSSFLAENLNEYFNAITNFSVKETVGLFGLEHNPDKKRVNPTTIIAEEVHELITSGTVINLANYKKIGGFDENLFIDGVDLDYCFSTLQKGLKCINFKNNFFVHSLGEKKKRRSFKSFYLIKKEKTLHSPLRLYYMIRNVLYLEKKYASQFPEYIAEMKKSYASHINKNKNYCSNILVFYKYKFKAISDFKNNRMGKIE